MKSLSLRARISIWTAGATSGALIVLAASTTAYVYLEDLEAIDIHLKGELLEFAHELAHEAIDADEFEKDEFESWLALGLFTPDGGTLARTPHFPHPLDITALPLDAFKFHQGAHTRWRITALLEADQLLVVAHDLEEFDEVQSDLITAQLIFLPLVAGLTAWLSWLIAGRSLEPIRRATAAAATIGTGDLSERLPLGQNEDEIQRFTQVLNDMLNRIEKSYNQARRFAGDASHELSTPLTIIKGEIERALNWNNLTEETEQHLLSVAQETDRMHQIIDQLMLLARFDAGQASHEFVLLNLSELLEDMAEDIDLLVTARDLKVRAEITDGIRVHGDPGHLRRLFRNLFTNAVKYNEPAGHIHYRLSRTSNRIIFEISNSGPLIPSALSEHIFERFFQSDQSHSRQGSGLGLSLCQEIVHAHGGQINLSPDTAHGNCFVVELPPAEPGPLA